MELYDKCKIHIHDFNDLFKRALDVGEILIQERDKKLVVGDLLILNLESPRNRNYAPTPPTAIP
jgi:hypothetical protein